MEGTQQVLQPEPSCLTSLQHPGLLQSDGVIISNQEWRPLSAWGSSPSIFITPQKVFLWPSKKSRWQPANGLADCSSTFQESGEEEFHFQRPLELNLASGVKRCSSRWNCLWMVPNRAASCQGLESSFPWTLRGLFFPARFWRTEKRGY